MTLFTRPYARGFILAITFSLFCSFNLFAQKAVVGKIKSRSNNGPLNAVTVQVKGTNTAALSNANGDFSITVPSGRKTLIFSAVGYDEIEVDVSSVSSTDVILKEKTYSLDEIVVTGYSVQKKKEITGAVSVVNVKDLNAVPAGSPEQMLQGRYWQYFL